MEPVPIGFASGPTGELPSTQGLGGRQVCAPGHRRCTWWGPSEGLTALDQGSGTWSAEW